MTKERILMTTYRQKRYPVETTALEREKRRLADDLMKEVPGLTRQDAKRRVHFAAILVLHNRAATRVAGEMRRLFGDVRDPERGA